MKTLQQQLVTYEGDYEDMFKKMLLHDIFAELLDYFQGDPQRYVPVVKYIANLYSSGSPFHLIKDTFENVKKRCAADAKLPESLNQQVMMLIQRDEFDKLPSIIIKTANKYLDYQNDADNRDLKSLNDLYTEMVRASHTDLKDGNGQINYELKFKCRKWANEIREMVEKAEGRMRNEDTQMKAAISELKNKQKMSKASLRPETSVAAK